MTQKKGFNIISHEGTLTKIKTIMRSIIVHLLETKQNQTKTREMTKKQLCLLVSFNFQLGTTYNDLGKKYW